MMNLCLGIQLMSRRIFWPDVGRKGVDRMGKNVMHKDLSHLTKKQVTSLIERYYKGESIKGLLNEYDLQITPNLLVSIFPKKKTDQVCEMCGSPVWGNYVSRSKPNKDHLSYFCPKCGHIPGASNCWCPACREKRQAELEALEAKCREEEKAEEERLKVIENEKRKAIQEAYGQDVGRVEYTALPIHLRIILGTLCLSLYDPNEQCLKPYESEESALVFEDRDQACEYIRELYKAKAIRVSPTSDIEAFLEENFPNTFCLDKVKYRLNFNVRGEEVSYSRMFDVAIGQGEPFILKESEKAAVVSLWESLLVLDCMQYMLDQFDRIHFNVTTTPKMEAYIREILQDYSVRETYYLIYTAIKSASRLYLEGGITKKHAVNIAVKTCKTYADRAKLQQWKITPYNRPKQLSPDDFFSFFFNRVVRVGEEAVCNLPAFGLGKGHTIDELHLFTKEE